MQSYNARRKYYTIEANICFGRPRPPQVLLDVVRMHATSVTMHMDVGFLGICAHVKDIGVSNYTKRLDPFKK